ncbi:MAG: tRNA lysidine(34) synthetase TilS [Nitrospinae bacterium]|nr:tRNA lysidine(34) synthetase TilS [Nitrospinota bacterium]
MDSLIQKFKKTLSDHKMIATGDCVLVGVSGGPDSVALLHGLHALKRELGIELVVAHLNHRARGAESDRDARFVQQLGDSLNIRTVMEAQDVPAEQAAAKQSFQETARNIRLGFFERARKQTGAQKVALGHIMDDQVETVLMNLLRGAGLTGLAGMSPVRSPYIRPLFECSRSEVIEFLRSRNISYCQDSSNEKTDYLRNRIRLELIPYLKDNYNPKIVENLFEASGIFRADNDWLNDLVDREFDRTASWAENRDSLEIDIETFSPLPLALKRRLVRKVLQALKGDLRTISSLHVQDLLPLFQATEKGKKIDLPGNLEAVCRGEAVVFKKIPKPGPGISIEAKKPSVWVGQLDIPGETEVGETGVTLKTEIVEPAASAYASPPSNQAFLDFDKTGGTILVRFFQPGDRLKPLGMNGTKKLKSLFIDDKVPREMRSRIPILTTGDNDIIWVYGTRIADPYRVTPKTKKVLFIKGLT